MSVSITVKERHEDENYGAGSYWTLGGGAELFVLHLADDDLWTAVSLLTGLCYKDIPRTNKAEAVSGLTRFIGVVELNITLEGVKENAG